MNRPGLSVSMIGHNAGVGGAAQPGASNDLVSNFDGVPAIKIEPEVYIKEEPAFFDASSAPDELHSVFPERCGVVKAPTEENPATALREKTPVFPTEASSQQTSKDANTSVGFQVILRSKSSGKTFRCDECAKVFRTERAVRNHLTTHQSAENTGPSAPSEGGAGAEGSSGGGPAPSSAGSDVDRYIAQRDVELRRRQLICDVCGVVFSRSDSLQKHVRENGGSDLFQCGMCPSSFVLKCGLALHKKKHVSSQSLSCCLCHVSFDDARRLLTHCMQQHAGVEPFRCNVCAKTFPQKIRFSLSCSLPAGQSGCHICGETFARKNLLFLHRQLLDGVTGPFSCDICEKSYSRRNTLEIHYETHGDVTRKTTERRKKAADDALRPAPNVGFQESIEPHQCLSCGKMFPSKGPLMDHYRTENCEKPFKCDVCGRTLLTEQRLKMHYRVHTGYKPFKCKVCGKTYTAKTALNNHVLVHADKKRHRCDACGRTFLRKYSLVSHSRLHTGKMMHSCETCGQTFVLRGSLKRHSCVRHENKRHRCETCGKIFSKVKGLRRHQRVHTGKLPFRCNVCGRRFNYSVSLANHSKACRQTKQLAAS